MQAPTPHDDPHEGISTDLPTLWQDAWNRHDAAGLAALVAPDVEFVTVAGLWLRGKPQFLAQQQRLHSTQMRSSTWSTTSSTVRALCEDWALAHVRWRIEGDFDPDGSPRSPRNGIFTWVLQRRPAALIVAAHNTNQLQPPAHGPLPDEK